MISVSTLRRAAGAATLFGILALGGAAPALADDFRIDAAWKAALENTDGVLTDTQHATINLIAYNSAAALLCNGIDIDAPRVAKVMDEIIAAGPPELTPDQQLERYTDILLMLGTAKGIILSEGALHEKEFCESATAAKAAADANDFWK
jgi:hypothetical protein